MAACVFARDSSAVFATTPFLRQRFDNGTNSVLCGLAKKMELKYFEAYDVFFLFLVWVLHCILLYSLLFLRYKKIAWVFLLKK